MSKDNYYIGNPIFSQILKILPYEKIRKVAKKHNSDKYIKRCDTVQHLITMLYGVMSGCNSLREVCSGIVSYGDKISHCNLKYAVPRSTLSDANRKRSADVFEEIYQEVLKTILPNLSDSRTKLSKDLKLYAIDSTTISLFQALFECNEIAIMDKAYNNYSAFAKWKEGGVYFVTRLKDNAKETLVRERFIGQ
jgi:hypothetical protein